MFLTRLVLCVLLVLLVVRALWRFLAGLAEGMGVNRGPSRRIEQGVRMARDPICGTFVIPASALAVRDADGLHHFCSDKCRDAFVARTRQST
jgi:YHS domain-containing protein